MEKEPQITDLGESTVRSYSRIVSDRERRNPIFCVPSAAHGKLVRVEDDKQDAAAAAAAAAVSPVTVLLARQVPFSPDGPHRSGH
ncbi:hypothetical protein CH63R_05554 [Colletotrichum higginsianum IMI 349063]|uniref:Uncharacterized protein n=1 Tax=Colletotrichum higginsianum (strain IMI 349063) TaxID=759273 RepID=A0A1B7YCY0_COLHI|nr:hypothetical protein CH63R_05554 [Colletotrichum higginsianum IMI 349063]OBR09862.1 hypothetical protein CH63R_05554 [Colletotrichum higginsianum IMI 349063]